MIGIFRFVEVPMYPERVLNGTYDFVSSTVGDSNSLADVSNDVKLKFIY